ncbi:MAG: glycosyltransferase [Sterolibacteriaceae bacterium]|nr:glycosyltransferase [Sterolibacteriaceae bacterium]MBK9086272.1 glycosyltransferase [Sterolibacteriaceae bacterium]
MEISSVSPVAEPALEALPFPAEKPITGDRFRFSSAALLIALAVAILNFVGWQWFNPAVDFVDWEKSGVQGFAYSGFQRNQDPREGNYPTDSDLRSDLQLLAGHTQHIRSYASAPNENLPRLASEYGLKLTAGAWLSTDAAANDREMAALVRSVRGADNVQAVIVGNESILRGDLSVAELAGYLKRVRGKLGVPVTAAEPWHVWLKHPELAREVDYITVHLLPYWEGVAVENAVDHVFRRYDELRRMFPTKRVVIGEVGWPSSGDRIGDAEASRENQARFMREFLDRTLDRPVRYYLMEAFDQPWKITEEGRAGGYWGMFDAYRESKYPLEGPVVADRHWQNKALLASALALLPMFAFAATFRRLKVAGRVVFCVLIQVCMTLFVWLAALPFEFYLGPVDWAMYALLMPALLFMMATILICGFELVEVIWARNWLRRFMPLAPRKDVASQPFVSIHLPCYNEPPEMVKLTLDSLAKLEYGNFEVLVIDNNTKDPSVWQPVEAYVSHLGPKFRFIHLDNWPGFKAGALNYALTQTDPRAEVIGVVDADYVVSPDWLSRLVGHFDAPRVAVVQAPQAHRDFKQNAFRRMCNWEFDGFFRIGMHHRNERDAIIQHGTMTLVRKTALVDSGNWSEWCICEDAELGLRLMNGGWETRYVDAVLGEGLTPTDFAAFKSQRSRWAFGAMQILKRRWNWLAGRGSLTMGQRFHFVTGWFGWFADSLHLVFTLASLAWTVGMVVNPANFSLPLPVYLVPVLGFLVAKALFGPVLYIKRVDCGWRDVFGASLASLALSHAIARGVLQGLWAKRGVFVRTAKGGRGDTLLGALTGAREEVLLLAALLIGAVVSVVVMTAPPAINAAGNVLPGGESKVEAIMWSVVLVAQSMPYLASLAVALVSARSASSMQRSSASPKIVPAAEAV